MTALLEVRDLEAFYGRTKALHGVSFSMETGGITTILGANGAGKTTTLRAISRMVRTSGAVVFDGQPLDHRVTEDVVRLGIAHDEAPGVGRQFALAPGVRVWLDSDTRLKFFTTLQFVFDHTEQGQFNDMTLKDTVADNDYGVRNSNGLMYDAIRNVGFYLQFGETIGFARWFRIELDLGLGVQVRFP